MTDEAKQLIDTLRCAAVFCSHCDRRNTCVEKCNAYRDANAAADLIERLSTELEAAKRDMQKALVGCGDAVCKLCAHYVKCDGDKCPEYTKGVGVRGADGREYPNFEWSCEDWEFGTCARMVNTPCNCCDFENHWEWRGLPKEE